GSWDSPELRLYGGGRPRRQGCGSGRMGLFSPLSIHSLGNPHMSLRATINDALKDAMKAGDKRRVSTLRLMNAAIKDKDINSRTEGHDSALTADAGLIDLFAKMVKQRQESFALYEQGGRPELAQQEREEIEVIQGY